GTCDVATYWLGQAASRGAMLLCAGTKGKRYALPHARVMIHQPLAGTEGTAEEILIHAKEFLRTKQTLNQLMAGHTTQPLERILKETDRDNFMSANQAREFGLTARVLERLRTEVLANRPQSSEYCEPWGLSPRVRYRGDRPHGSLGGMESRMRHHRPNLARFARRMAACGVVAFLALPFTSGCKTNKRY